MCFGKFRFKRERSADQFNGRLMLACLMGQHTEHVYCGGLFWFYFQRLLIESFRVRETSSPMMLTCKLKRLQNG